MLSLELPQTVHEWQQNAPNVFFLAQTYFTCDQKSFY